MQAHEEGDGGHVEVGDVLPTILRAKTSPMSETAHETSVDQPSKRRYSR